MASGDMLGIGVSALLSYQRSLATTGHNIANVNTDGYSRQRTDLTQRVPQYSGNGFIGTGVEVVTTQRIYNQFLVNEVRNNSTSYKQTETFYQFASGVDRLLADAQAGLQPGLDSFFNAVQQLADFPTSSAVRQTVYSEAESLTARFDTLSQQLGSMRNSADLQLRNTVSEINGLASSIAALNERIVSFRGGASQGQLPNDLQDQRDELLRQLAERVRVTALEQDDGALNVFIGNGQTLVAGNRASTLATLPGNFDASQLEIAFSQGGTTIPITGQISGGVLGGLLQFRSEVLDPAFNELGRVAIGLADTFNDQHQLGQDLLGNPGGLFFNDLAATSPTTFASTTNTGTGVIAAAITDVNTLTSSDYRLNYVAGTYSLIRLSDNTTVSSGASLAAIAADGLSFSLASGALASGDSYLIRPTLNGAADIALSIATPEAIAAAAPIRTATALANTGNGVISAGTVNAPPPADANLQQTVTITFDNPPTTFDVVGTGTGNPTNVAYTSGGSITYNGWTIQLSGTPAAGDVFTIEANTGGVGDNRNALLLAGLQTQNTLQNGTATFQSAYASFVASAGVQTHQADISQQAQKSLLDQAVVSRDAISGVNLDEEAANLVKFQQAYQAAAQVIATANTLFETLIGAVRR
ncbi:MAG: flagellar hook-associated protein FlgK [Proteobacteria bacterium]|nr:MAG: flagellar hook-associated protein FlgK [Pseudomonadota bacterium]